MNGDEAVKLTKMVRYAVPSQSFEDETAVIWAMALKNVRFEDAMQAVVNLVGDDKRDSPYIAPSDVRREVKRIRGARLDAFGPLPAPPKEVQEGTSGQYQAWMRDAKQQIADGTVTRADQLPQALPPTGTERPTLELLAGAFRSVDDVEPVEGEQAI